MKGGEIMSIFRNSTATDEKPKDQAKDQEVKIEGDQVVLTEQDENGQERERRVRLPKTKWA
jgi:hypothetical protein